MQEIEVSAIILTCNRPERCLDSAWHNTLAMSGLNAETIVIDNGSQPVSIPAAIAGIPCRTIRMKSNRGIAARNEGIKAARGRYLLMIDDDAYVDPGLVQAMVKAFGSDPDLAAVAFRVINGNKEEACLLPSVFHGCACGFRRNAILHAGGYPSDYLYYGEEYDLAFRLYALKYRIAVCSGPGKVRHMRDGAGRNTGKIISLLVRNNSLFIWSCFPLHAIAPALKDVLQRYRLVAKREGVSDGYAAGLRRIPEAALRGMLRRKAMTRDIFQRATLCDKISATAVRLAEEGVNEAALCGVGKFPRLWIDLLRRRGIRTKYLADFNQCWTGQDIDGIPVLVPEDERERSLENLTCITGAGSHPETLEWQNTLFFERGLLPWGPLAGEASFSTPAIIDLSDFNRIAVFRPQHAFSATKQADFRNGTRAANERQRQ